VRYGHSRSADRPAITLAKVHELGRSKRRRLARYLHRNGVLCEPITVQPEGRSTGEAILAHAASLQT
jgi:hypothetical protein